MENEIIIKQELSDKEKEIKNKFFNSKPKQDEHLQKNNLLLGATKTSLKDLKMFDELNKNSNEKKDEDTAIKKILEPIYAQISSFKDEIKSLNELTDIKNNEKIKTKSLSKNDINSLYNLHLKFQQNKTNVSSTLEYMNNNISEVSYEDVEIVKALDDLRATFEVMSKEMESIENDFNDKFEYVIKERKRQQIANDLMNGTYKVKEDYQRKLLNSDINDDMLPSSMLDKVDYSKYIDDLCDINKAKDFLFNDYKSNKENFASIPILVDPKEKIRFCYDIEEEENEKNSNDINTKKNKRPKQMNNSNNTSNVYKSTQYQTLNNNNSSSNIIRQSNEESKSEVMIYENKSENIEEVKEVHEEEEKKKNLSPAEKMSIYQRTMKNVQIETAKPKKIERKTIIIGDTKEDFIRKQQPRSSKTKQTFQTFKKKVQPPLYIYEQYPIKRKGFKNGKYPSVNTFDVDINNQNINKDTKINTEDYKVFYPEDNLSNQNMKEIIEKTVALYIKDAMHNKRNQNQNDPQNFNNENFHSTSKNNNNSNRELMSLLIKKFEDLENAIRNPSSSLAQNSNHGMMYSTGNQSQDIADLLYNKIKNDMNININLEGIFSHKSEMNDEVNESTASQLSQSHRRVHFAVNPNNTNYSVNRSTRDNKETKEAKPIPLFDDDNNINIDQLDTLIEMPHHIDLNQYEISNTSSYISEQHKNLSSIVVNDNKKENESNSLSKGQIESEFDDDMSIRNENNQIRNRTGQDLLLLKNFNENLPMMINIDNNNNDISSISSSFGNSFEHNAREVIDINNNAKLKKLQLYESKEFNDFKSKFLNNINNNNASPIMYSFGNVDNANLLPNTNINKDIDNIIQRQSELSKKIKMLSNNSSANHISEGEVLSSSSSNAKVYHTDESSSYN